MQFNAKKLNFKLKMKTFKPSVMLKLKKNYIYINEAPCINSG